MGLPYTWRGEGVSGLFRGVVARGLLPSRMGRIPGILVWLSPQDPLQLHVDKKGQLISPGCWAGLICDHGHGAQRACGQAGTGGHQWARAGLWGAASPGCQGYS